MRRTEVTVASAALALITLTLALSAVSQVFSAPQTTITVSNTGTVKAIGIGVYWDYECNNPVSSINWGTLEPGTSTNVICYIRNEGNSASTLSMYTSNWDPQEATSYITFDWDYSGQSIDIDEAIKVVLTLSISEDIVGITSFSFDITIVGSG